MNFWVDPLANSASISGRCLSSLLLPGPFYRPTGRPEARLARRASFVRAEINPARSRRQSFPRKQIKITPENWEARNEIKPHKNRYRVIPPKAIAVVAAAMEDVLDVYTHPYDPARPLVCLDDTSKQLTQETHMPLLGDPGRAAQVDCEYERAGVASLFMLFAPLEGWCYVFVRERRTAIDYAHILRELADVISCSFDKITLEQENLNTHEPASSYKVFPPAEASRIAERFEWHNTLKHGSWFNIAECEHCVFTRQCLARRIPDQTDLAAKIEAWETTQNGVGSKCDWKLTTQDARIKLSQVYLQLL